MKMHFVRPYMRSGVIRVMSWAWTQNQKSPSFCIAQIRQNVDKVRFSTEGLS